MKKTQISNGGVGDEPKANKKCLNFILKNKNKRSKIE